jgi:periplasmic copper chaperone A
MKYFSMLVVTTASTLLLFSCNAADEVLQLEWRDGWVRALPPGSSMTAAYGEIWNTSQETIILDAFDSNAFASVSMHQSIIEDGVSRMQQQVNVRIAAGEMLQLQPGGMHLMLMGADRNVVAGGEIVITVTSGGQRFLFNLPVEAR